MRCPSCGTENPENSRFCMSCASPLMSPQPAAPVAPMPPPPPPPPPPLRARHREPHEDILGLMSLAFVLIAVSVVFGLNPNLATELQDWTRLVTNRGTVFVRPPEGIIMSAAWFFAVVGVFEFLAAAVRGALRWTPLRVAGRVLAGAGDLVFAALLFLYSARTISGAFLIAVLAGAVGVLLMVYVTLGMYWSTARYVPRPETVQPPAHE